ncbi:Lethal(2) giant larvae sro7 [Recurvomyces mirabilis]|uniref:Lethal(2) giant larvae sro7 n=1 Tax=Recurvomyces mirabilis TaxID=574656 RepID=A0AAE1C4C1_9PEZI|nr:Lethal(2) giant larvae sro7 [Recurvomyces mirabilis]KAK5159396.1 Lethal(2) giant larvae sro7 [Recurvomyces mirabilis]
MAFLRGKQSGIQNDLSAGIAPDNFNPDDLARFGINSQISTLAYDPVQSLLAVGTKSSEFAPGQIYIFGQQRVQATFPLPRQGAGVKSLQFVADKLVCLDSKHDIAVYSLELKKLLSSHSPPGIVTVLCTDPMLDYALLGMQTGEILAYDLDRETLAPFRIPNLWMGLDPRTKISTIVSLHFHPRDIGSLLVGYTHGAVIYSFKLAKALRHFQYEIPKGAPGGDGDPALMATFRRPRLTQAAWHPTGTFIITGHEDSSLVFWDTLKDGRMIMARTVTDTNVATPGAPVVRPMSSGRGVPTMAVKEPLFRIVWCANQDPEDTAILIAGGQSTQSPSKGLTLFEMGRTPVYATSTWEAFSQYCESPKRQRILPTPPGAEVIDFCLIPRASPHFAGAHDPLAVIALLSSGELLTLSFPSGMPISPTNQLHPSLTFVHPFLKSINVAQTSRERWLGMTERRQQGPPVLRGGAESLRSLRRYESRNIIQTIHADGTIRLWDTGHGDEVENGMLLQVDVARAVGRFGEVDVTKTSLAGASGELALGLRSGELVVFRWGNNSHAGREPPAPRPNQPGQLTNVSDRIEPALSEGLIPTTLLAQQDGPVTAIRMSEVGFLAAGFEGGSISVIDMRGPAIIYSASVSDFSKSSGKGSLRGRGNSSAGVKPEWATHIEFSVMTLDGDDYSSILLHIGTNLGHLATFKIVPDPSGRYTVQYAGSLTLDSGNRILHISPLNADTGKPASATQQTVSGLRTGLRLNGVLLVVTTTSIHIFRPATSKGAHKSFDSYFCDSASICRYQDSGYALVALFGDGYARAYSIPALREIAAVNISNTLNVRRFSEAVITPTGHILGFTGPSELALLNVWGVGDDHAARLNGDKLFNPSALIPPRPTISTVAWVTGTQYITPSDLTLLISGPGRPVSKRMLQQQALEAETARKAGRAGGKAAVPPGAAGAAGTDQETYWAYMQRQVQERTEKLGLVGDGVENLEANSAGWMEDVNKYVNKQKRGVATSVLKAKFGF